MSAAIDRLRIAIAAFLAVACLLPQYASGSQPAPVPRMVIYAGDKISDAILEERVLQLGHHPERFWHLRRDGLIGKVARRTLLPGQAIPLLAVKQPDVVNSGKQVTLVFAVGAMTITGRGVAVQSGGVGDTISVQSHDGGTVLRGIVAPDGSVRLGD